MTNEKCRPTFVTFFNLLQLHFGIKFQGMCLSTHLEEHVYVNIDRNDHWSLSKNTYHYLNQQNNARGVFHEFVTGNYTTHARLSLPHTHCPPPVVLSTHNFLHITMQYTPFSRSLSCNHDKLVRSSSEVRLHWLWATASSIDMGDCASHIGVPAIGLPGADIFGVTACSCGVLALSGDICKIRWTLCVSRSCLECYVQRRHHRKV